MTIHTRTRSELNRVYREDRLRSSLAQAARQVTMQHADVVRIWMRLKAACEAGHEYHAARDAAARIIVERRDANHSEAFDLWAMANKLADETRF
jgi:hypothetical protein